MRGVATTCCGSGTTAEPEVRTQPVGGAQFGQAGRVAFDHDPGRVGGQFGQQGKAGAVDRPDRAKRDPPAAGQQWLRLLPQCRGRGAVDRATEHQRVALADDAGGHGGSRCGGHVYSPALSLPALRSAATSAIDLRDSGPSNWLRNVCTKLTPSTITSNTFQSLPTLRIR